jgi:CRP-like cAMP-binding protein
MDDMDFTKPQALDAPAPSSPLKATSSRFYDSAAAEKVFRKAGREERFAAGQQIFAEDDKAGKSGLFSRRLASRMYFVADGEVALAIGGKPLDTIKAGEVLGEMGVISELPRSATATAKTDCVTFSLDTAELQAALSHAPEFGLMLASIMFERLRFLAARLASRPLAKGAAAREATVFSPELLHGLEVALPRSAIVRYPASTIIMKEGQAGAYMYVVKTGRVAIAVGANIVEAVGPGGTFGEMALIDQSPRTARAGAVVDSELLAIDRAALLEVVKKQPAFGMAMLRGIADRLRHMNSLLG